MKISQIIRNGEHLKEYEKNAPEQAGVIRVSPTFHFAQPFEGCAFWQWGKRGATPAKLRYRLKKGTPASRALRSLALKYKHSGKK